MTPEKTIKLACGGTLVYRLPNCIEQLRFYIDTKWNSKELLVEQIESSLEFIDKFIIEIKSKKYKTLDDLINDRSNVNQITELALDIGNQSLPEVKKKS